MCHRFPLAHALLTNGAVQMQPTEKRWVRTVKSNNFCWRALENINYDSFALFASSTLERGVVVWWWWRCDAVWCDVVCSDAVVVKW